MTAALDNTQRLFNGLATVLGSTEAEQSAGDGTLYAERTTEGGRHYRLDDYHSFYLTEPPSRDIQNRRTALANGMAWLCLREVDAPNVAAAELLGDEYSIVDPGNIDPEKAGFMLDILRTSLDGEPQPGKPIIFAIGQRLFIPDPIENDFLREVFERVVNQ